MVSHPSAKILEESHPSRFLNMDESIRFFHRTFQLGLFYTENGQKFELGDVGFAANFLSSLAPCTRTIIARSRQEICAAALPNSTFDPFSVYTVEIKTLSVFS